MENLVSMCLKILMVAIMVVVVFVEDVAHTLFDHCLLVALAVVAALEDLVVLKSFSFSLPFFCLRLHCFGWLALQICFLGR